MRPLLLHCKMQRLAGSGLGFGALILTIARVCRAAVHAGVIGADGWRPFLSPFPARLEAFYRIDARMASKPAIMASMAAASRLQAESKG